MVWARFPREKHRRGLRTESLDTLYLEVEQKRKKKSKRDGRGSTSEVGSVLKERRMGHP